MQNLKFPDWAGFTPDSAAAQLPRLLAEAEQAVEKIEASNAITYDELVSKLDDATRPLWQCWGAVSHMLSVMNSEAWRKLEDEWQPKVVEFSLRVSQSKKLYELSKIVRANLSDAVRQRIVDKMIQGAELSGVGLEGENKARFNDIQMRLAKLGADFHNAVIDATTPEIADAAYTETMKHNPDRALRERLYRARVSRAPENGSRISEILSLRQQESEILGFPNYAAKSLATKCAPSVDSVLDMIDKLDTATIDKATEERLDVEPWDVAFEAERLREQRYSYSEEELKRHFELEDVVNGLFRITKFLFDVEVEEITEKPSVWHEDVRFFAVKEAGKIIAHFYFDPFVRTGLKSGGAWMNEFRNRSTKTLPLAVIVTNFPKQDQNGKCYLPLREVETLFHEFGHALQCMLTRIEEEDAAGINLVEWDAVEVASQFMENWCMDDRTGISVPKTLKEKVRAAKNFRAATACRRQLAFAKVDMQLHLSEKDKQVKSPSAMKTEVFSHFGLPMIAEDKFLCAFTHIFSGGYAAGYYGYKWAEVMSADCYGAFEEVGLSDDAAVSAMGKRYRETILALGGSKSALEVFKDFRGRLPDTTAILRQQDLLPAK